MLQHADSRLLSNYQFGAKSALAAVSLTQLLSSGIKDSTTVQQPLPQGTHLAQSPLNSEGSTSATPPLHLECSTTLPQDICAQSSVWSDFLNGGSSNSFMGDNIDSNTIPNSTTSATSSWWNSTRDQELQAQWNQSTVVAAPQTTQPSTAPQAPMAELEGGDWSPGQLGCLPTAPEVNEQQLSTMALEQTDYSTMNTALVDPEISSAPGSWGSILMGGTGSEEQTLETGTVEGLQEALFSKSFLGRPDLLSDVNMLKKPGESSWEFNPLKGAAAAFEMDEMNKQQFAVGSGHDERMLSVDNWSIMNSRGGSNSYPMDVFGGGSQFVPGKIKQEIDTQYFSTNVSGNPISASSPQSLADSFKSVQMLPASDVQTRWEAHSSRLPAMLSRVLPSASTTATKPANLFGSNMQMGRSFGNYSSSKATETYKGQREQSSMSQHSSITSQHSYDSKDSRASKHMMEESREVSSDQKRSGEHHASDTFFKRPRIEQQQAPTLPFKATTFVLQVRKEKLGERITALQQLVAPFGKTDTASVLLEAIGYIKFLHEQVQVLSTPYMKNPAATAGRSNEGAVKGSSWSSEGNKSKDGDEPRQDLRSRGLCLVPISCTLQVANDNGADFWTPNIGGTGK